MDSSSLLPHALNYAENWKLAVFPAPLGTKKSHKAEKYSGTPWGATRDTDEIRKDFTKWPDANIGIPTGAGNGVFVLDVDTIDGHGRDGFASLATLEAEHGKLPPTRMAKSPSGSLHYYFAHPGFAVKTSESEIADGIDIRGDGGMVLVQPSRKPDGGAYEWVNDLPFAGAPQWLKDRVKDEQGPKASLGTARVAPAGLRPTPGLQSARVLEEACKRVAAAEEGTRNGVLNDQAFFVGHWVGSGEIGADVAAHDLLVACDACGLIADGEQQCLATINSGIVAGAKEPARTLDDMFPSDLIKQVVADMVVKAEATPPKKLIQSSEEFVANFVAPAYLLDGILQKQFCYSLTAATGAGKTAIALRLAAHVALGRKLGDRDVEKGRVLYFAAENYVDVQARWIAMGEHSGFDVNTVDVHFVPGATKLSEIASRITAEATAIGDLALVIVDTSAATFEGDDENGNVDAGTHARRMRSLTELRGRPSVLVLCHPVKNATTENLVPRGGGAFIAEIDGNLCARKSDSAVEVHWAGKFRGMDFAPIMFRLDTVVAQRLKDARGRNIPTVMATPIDDAAKQAMAVTERSDQDQVLKALDKLPGASLNKIAEHLEWTMRDGKPYGVRVNRTLAKLAKDGLVFKHRNEWVLSKEGQIELNKMDRKSIADGTSHVSLPPLFPLPMTPKH